MVILKKIKASTLMETLVATVLIIVIFILASMILNSLFSNNIKNNTAEIETHLNELEYKYQTGVIAVPYDNEFKLWQVSIERFAEGNNRYVKFSAANKSINKTVIRKKFEKH